MLLRSFSKLQDKAHLNFGKAWSTGKVCAYKSKSELGTNEIHRNRKRIS